MGLDLSNRRCLITGAGSGIGEALAWELAEEGADVVLMSRPEEADKLGAMREAIAAAHDVDVRTYAVYAASKAFVQSFSEAIHAELAPHGVHVGTLNPPYTSTPMIAEIPELPWNRLVPTMTPKDVARAGVQTLKRERLYYVPDWQSRLANAYAPRIMPRRLTAWLSSRLLEPKSE